MDSRFLSDPTDIKILICYTLSCVKAPQSRDSLSQVLTANGDVNYFSLFDAVEELIRDGFVTDNEGSLSVTDKGLQIASAFNRKLPASLRESAAVMSLRLAAKERSKTENPCVIIPLESGGFNVDMRICDGDSELLRITVYASDREQAELLKKRFESDPTLIYTGMIALLTGDMDSVGGILLSSPQ